LTVVLPLVLEILSDCQIQKQWNLHQVSDTAILVLQHCVWYNRKWFRVFSVPWIAKQYCPVCDWEQPKWDCPWVSQWKGVQRLLEVHQVPSGITVICFLLVVIFHSLVPIMIKPLLAHMCGHTMNGWETWNLVTMARVLPQVVTGTCLWIKLMCDPLRDNSAHPTKIDFLLEAIIVMKVTSKRDYCSNGSAETWTRRH